MGLKQDVLSQPVSRLPLRPAISMGPQTPVRRAMEAMREARLGCVVVVDDLRRPLGKFTERRLMKALVEQPGCLDHPIERYMFGRDDCVRMSEPILKLVEHMEREKLRYMIVLNDYGQVTALTGQKGVMEFIAEHFPRQVKVQYMQAKLHLDEREGA